MKMMAGNGEVYNWYGLWTIVGAWYFAH